MRYSLKQIHCRPWLLNGLSLKLIESHYENNYGGALRRLNAITEQLESLDFANTPGYVVNGLKREELIALNSTLLHELYFASLGGDGKPTERARRDVWRATSARSIAGAPSSWPWRRRSPAARAGFCWSTCRAIGRLINQYAADHCAGSRGRHADPRARHVRARLSHRLRRQRQGLRRQRSCATSTGRRVEGALRGRGESRAAARRSCRRSSAICPASASRKSRRCWMPAQPVQLIDVRPRHYVSRTAGHRGRARPGATRIALQDWIGELSKSEPVVVYCAYGFHVGCGTAVKLREAGFDAKYMKRGHSGWKAFGGSIKMHP